MSREVRRVVLVATASALGFGVLVLLRRIANEPLLQPNDIWVVLVWAGLVVLLLVMVTAAGRRPPPGRRR